MADTSGVYHLMVSKKIECGYGFRLEKISIVNLLTMS